MTNERNGREVIVRVTDRGPHSRGRIIDLSHAAAEELGIINQGVAVVRVEPVKKTVVPFKPEPESIPEIDFEITEYTLPASGILHFPTYGKKTHQLKGDNKDNKKQKEIEGNKKQEKTEANGKTIKEKKDSNHKTVQPQKRSNVRNKSKAKGKRKSVRRK